MTHPYSDPATAPWALLARHLAAEATPAERAELRAWVQEDPAHLQILTTVTRAWERAGEATTVASPIVLLPADVEAAWLRFKPVTATAPAAPPAAPVAAAPRMPAAKPLWPLQRRAAARRWQVVAGLVLLLGAGIALARTWLAGPRQVEQTYASAATRRLIHLPDGSRVWLNANSRLSYAGVGAVPAEGLRTVQLTGEAYFEVQHNATRPFVVRTTTARVQVTGTAFNVRAYAAEDSVEVSVIQGQVWLASLAPADSVVLRAGTRAALRATDAPGRVATRLRSYPSADPNFRAWQTDTLRFDDAPLSQVVRTLQVTFGTQLALSNPNLAHCRFTGTFPHPQPAQVLAVLATVTASRLVPNGQGGYQLQGAGCAPTPPPPTAPLALRPLQP